MIPFIRSVPCILRAAFLPFLVLAGAALSIVLLCVALAHLFSPQLGLESHRSSPALVEKVRLLRDAPADRYHSTVQVVDYGQGGQAAWFPKYASPLLEELAATGKIPPVAARTGAEPLVLAGPDGKGEYGGTWYATFTGHDDINSFYLVCQPLFARWSPNGYPIRPNFLKGWTANEDRTIWILQLRHGVRWSDGAPATADDILFSYEDVLSRNPDSPPDFLRTSNGHGTMEKMDDYTVRVVFPSPKPDFEEMLTQMSFISPQHYLRNRHPQFGDPKMVKAEMARWGASSKKEFYNSIRRWDNPELPVLGPWIYREYKGTPPQVLVRNPYYWAVDPDGRQLPYIDRVVCSEKDAKMIPFDAAAGGVTLQWRHISSADYPLYISGMETKNYEVLHWRSSDGGPLCIYPDLNLHSKAGDPAGKWKLSYLNKADFRKALSLSLNRQIIIDAEYNGLGQPSQAAPDSTSPFYMEGLSHAFTSYEPGKANAMLDAIGLDRRDADGFRAFPDGTPMLWRLSYTKASPGAVQFIKNDLANVGIRAADQYLEKGLASIRSRARELELLIDEAGDVENPLIRPDMFVPNTLTNRWAPGYAQWFLEGGLQKDSPDSGGAIAPPPGDPVREAMSGYIEAVSQPTLEGRIASFRKVLEIAGQNLWTINVSSPLPTLLIKDRDLKNVPLKASFSYVYRTPLNAGPEVFFFSNPAKRNDGSAEAIRHAMTGVTLPPFATLSASTPAITGDSKKSTATPPSPRSASSWIGSILQILLGLWVIWMAFRYPYIGRRILIMIPTLFIISFIGFFIFQIPPGNFVDSRRAQYELQGDPQALHELDEMISIYHLDRPALVQYGYWLGLPWFTTFKDQDRGLLQGFLGRRMEDGRPVNDIVGDRIVLTIALSAFSILFTYLIALPIGVLSACRQYTFWDYFFTSLGFIGMSVPNFLLAVVLIYVGNVYFGTNLTGLFSPEYALQEGWTWGKVVDLLKHIWVPVVVIGVAGTAGMIRVMRANLLDELNKPYVVTARAKGVRPFKLLLKYPIRLAINPFIAHLGHLLPHLLSGGGLVSIVMSLPTIGPLLLYAVMNQDFYLASSMLMVFSVLGVVGTLISDLMLIAIDPRIRLERRAG